MAHIQQTSTAYFNTLRIIHLALFAGQLLLGGIFYFLVNQNPSGSEHAELGKMFEFSIPALLIGGVVTGYIAYRQLVPAIQKLEGLAPKLERFRALLILRYALWEGPVIFALIGFFLTHNQLFLYLAGAGMVAFFFLRPQKEAIAETLALKGEELKQFNDPDAIVASMRRR